MTDAEIIKALEYWKKFNDEIDSLLPAPPDVEEMLDEQKKIVKTTLEALEALALTNRQKVEFDDWHRIAQLNAAEIMRLQAEIEQLKEQKESLETLVLSYGDYVAKTRAEAIRDFAEEVKKNRGTLFNSIYSDTHFRLVVAAIARDLGVDIDAV